MPVPFIPFSPVIQMSYLDALVQQTLDYHSNILLARAYHDGIQPIYLTDRQKEYLDLHADNQFCLNVTRLVVTALRDELNIVGFDTGEAPNDEGVKVQAQWFWNIWDLNFMDGTQSEVHEWALRDSEAFILLDWDKEKKYPVMVLHERFTDIHANSWEGRWSDLQDDTIESMTGTGNGVWMIYENDDPKQEAQAAIQQWTEIIYKDDGSVANVIRRTIYYPDRIERFYFDGTEFTPTVENPVTPWLDKKDKPLGIPVIHFKNLNMRPEAWDAIPPQDAINKTWVDILGSMDLSGFPLFFIIGMYPTTDGLKPAEDNSNVWRVGPAQMLGNANNKAGDVTVQKEEGSDPTAAMNTLKDQIVFLAQITGTPASRFVSTAQIASAETLKEQDRQLKKRANNRMILFGNAWKNVMLMARRINNAFGTDELDEKVSVEPIWKTIESLDDLKIESDLGVTQDTIWGKMGYTQEKVKEMKSSTEYRLKFIKAFWEAYASASSSGVTVEAFAKSVGIPDKQITELTAGMSKEKIPPKGL